MFKNMSVLNLLRVHNFISSVESWKILIFRLNFPVKPCFTLKVFRKVRKKLRQLDFWNTPCMYRILMFLFSANLNCSSGAQLKGIFKKRRIWVSLLFLFFAEISVFEKNLILNSLPSCWLERKLKEFFLVDEESGFKHYFICM